MATDGFFDESSEQSRIKAEIVSKYFWAWAKVILPSVKQRGGTIAYIDLFAGPGRYKDSSRSTPLLVLEQAIADPEMCRHLSTVFNDASKEFASALRREIDALPGIERLAHQPIVHMEEVGEGVVGLFGKRGDVPTLFFVDPWGYKGLSLGLVNSVLKNWGCDCIFFFNYNRINPGLNNPAVRQHMDVLFGEERARALREKLERLQPSEREVTIVEELSLALREFGANYVLPFCFKNGQGNRTSHHLIFATKHPKGYEIMKGIMAPHSAELHQGVPSFAYCPASTIHPLLFELNRPLDDLEGMLLDAFAGQTVSVDQIYHKHNVGRPYLRKNYKDVLRAMESRGIVQANPTQNLRPRNTLADRTLISFPKRTRQNPETK
jgi:three-Cys-motif partner protein